MDLLLPWLVFSACVALIGFGGYHMSRAADLIAARTGMSRTWIGLLLLSVATSLPELITGVSAIRLTNLPDLAVGDALGSCVFNLLVLVLLEVLLRRRAFYAEISTGHTLSAALGVVLVGFIAMAILIPPQLGELAIGHVGLYTPIILVLYLASVRVVFRFEHRNPAQVALPAEPAADLRSAIIRYALAAALVVGAGTAVPFAAHAVAGAMGWSSTFMGTIFVALSTSVPELAVAVSAFRLGALDMAVGNLLGSNLFDAAIIAVHDIVYTEGPLLAAISPAHAVTAIAAVVMSGIAIVAFFYRSTSRFFRLIGWPGMLLLLVYLTNAFLLFVHGA